MTPHFMNSMVPVLMTAVRTLPSCLIQIYGPDTWFNVQVLVAFPCPQVHTSSLHLSLYTYPPPLPLHLITSNVNFLYVDLLTCSQVDGKVNLFRLTVSLDRDWSELVSDHSFNPLTSCNQFQSGFITIEEICGRLRFDSPEMEWKVEPSRTFNH